MNNKTPEHLKDVPADKLKILSEVHKPRNSIGFAKDLAALVEESKPKPKTKPKSKAKPKSKKK